MFTKLVNARCWRVAFVAVVAVGGLLFFCAVNSGADEPKPGASQASDTKAANPNPAPAKKPEATPNNAQAVVTAGGRLGGGNAVDIDVDPQDADERFLLLADGGPIIVQLAITIDGQPFRMAREKLVDQLLAAADTDKDGKATWDEAIANRRFGFVQFGRPAQKDALEKQMKGFDANNDGVVDRAEARRYMAQSQGAGSAFNLTPYQFGAGAQNAVRDLLDADHDGTISAEEIDAASDRLHSRDANDDELVSLAELGGGQTGLYGNFIQGRGAAAPAVAVALRGANAQSLHQQIRQRYGKQDKLSVNNLPLTASLVPKLDANGDGEIQPDELAALEKAEAHLAVTVALASKEESTVTVKSVAPGLGSKDSISNAKPDELAVALPGTQLRLSATGGTTAPYNFADTAKRILMQFDTDNNGYLEEKELANQQGLKQQAAAWDENGDGKIYPEEMVAAYERQLAPQMSQVQALVSQQGSSLFSVLDTSGDSRLSLRELRHVAERLKTIDKDKDGKLTPAEVPDAIVVNLSRGNLGMQRAFGGFSTGGRGQPAAPAAKPAGPDWFVRMDRNGDGDVTPREFFGTPEQFRKLDTDGDGFIDPKEAEAAKQ